MRSVQKTRVKLFRLRFSTGPASRNAQSKKVESKKPFFDCVRKPDLGFSRKRPFSTDKPDCIRNGLRSFLGDASSSSTEESSIGTKNALEEEAVTFRSVESASRIGESDTQISKIQLEGQGGPTCDVQVSRGGMTRPDP